MTYDVLIMDTDNLKDAFDIGSICIRLNGMTPQDAEALYDPSAARSDGLLPAA